MNTEWFTASNQLMGLFWGVVVFAVSAWFILVLAGARRIGKPRLAIYFGLAIVAWGGLALVISHRGGFLPMGLPPRLILFLFAGLFAILIATRKTDLGRAVDAVPIGALVLLQGFRLPLELVMHGAALEGVMPPQMTYTGFNFDIVTGGLALLIGFWALFGKAPHWVLWAFNVIGSVFLLAVVTIAVLSMPTPLRMFSNDPPNVWITFVPFVFLPVLLVVCAFWSHIEITRRLLRHETANG